MVCFNGKSNSRYVNDILENTPVSADQVTIEPDGKWSQTSGIESSSKNSHDQPNIGDKELVEIKDVPQITAAKTKVGLSASPANEQIVSAPTPSSASSKRSIGQVIDLTFSSDEDDEPPRAPKRQLTNSSLIGLSTLPGSEVSRPRLNNENSRDPKHFPAKAFHTSNYIPRPYAEPH